MALRISSTTCCTALPALSPSLPPSYPPSYDNKTRGTCPSVRVFSPRSVRVCRHQHQQGLCFHVRHKGASYRTRTQCLMEARLGRTGGAGVLERPGLDQSQPSQEPRVEEGGDMGKLSQRHIYGGGDRYRVLLLDHERHTEAQVASVLPKVVPSLTANEARKCFQISREKGVGIVTVTVKEHAEFYAQMMARCGLRSGIEPDGDTI